MALAACHGGMAFSNSATFPGARHEPADWRGLHLPHGLPNAVLLPAVTRFSIAGAPARYSRVSQEMGWREGLVDGLERLNEEYVLQTPGCLRNQAQRVGADLKKIAEDALASGSPQIIRLFRLSRDCGFVSDAW